MSRKAEKAQQRAKYRSSEGNKSKPASRNKLKPAKAKFRKQTYENGVLTYEQAQ